MLLKNYGSLEKFFKRTTLISPFLYWSSYILVDHQGKSDEPIISNWTTICYCWYAGFYTRPKVKPALIIYDSFRLTPFKAFSTIELYSGFSKMQFLTSRKGERYQEKLQFSVAKLPCKILHNCMNIMTFVDYQTCATSEMRLIRCYFSSVLFCIKLQSWHISPITRKQVPFFVCNH